MAASRRSRKHAEEEHEDSERWLVTYADMLTVLMALFIVMFAISTVDAQKFDAFKAGAHEYFGNGPDLTDGGSGLLAQNGNRPTMAPDVQAAVLALEQQQAQAQAVVRERADLEAAKQRITEALDARGLGGSARFAVDERGLVVTLVTDEVLFDLGAAVLRDRGREVLDGVASGLREVPNRISVEGHTDDLPIRGGGTFPSNWELSTARATTVLRYLTEAQGVPPQRVSAAGYADQRPLVPNTPDQRQVNRRVEIVVLASQPEAALAVTPAAGAVPVPLAADQEEEP